MARSKGQIAEKRILKRIEARPQPRSGGIVGFPADGIKGEWMIEVKSTVKKSLSVKAEWLSKVELAAARHGKQAALLMIFDDLSGTNRSLLSRSWVAAPAWLWESLGLWEKSTSRR